MHSPPSPPRSYSFLLRLWEERSDARAEASTWRYMLERVGGDERHMFPDLEALVTFLRAEIERGNEQRITDNG